MKALQTTATKGSNKTLKNLKEGIMKTKIMATCLVVALMFLVGGHALASPFPFFVTAQSDPIEFGSAGTWLPLGEGSSWDIYRTFWANPEETMVVLFNGVCSVKSTDTNTSVDIDIYVHDGKGWHIMYPTAGINPLCTSDGTGTFSGPVSVSTNAHWGQFEATFNGGPHYVLIRARLVNATAQDRGRLDNYSVIVITE